MAVSVPLEHPLLLRDIARMLGARARPSDVSCAVKQKSGERGYAGGYSQLKVLVASLQPPAEPEPIGRFETEPVKQCRIDFVIFRRRPTKFVAFTALIVATVRQSKGDRDRPRRLR